MNERQFKEAMANDAYERNQAGQVAPDMPMSDVRRGLVGGLTGPTWRQEEVIRQFESRSPADEQAARMALVREAGKAFALTLQAHTPPGAELESAIMNTRICVMLANSAIVAG